MLIVTNTCQKNVLIKIFDIPNMKSDSDRLNKRISYNFIFLLIFAIIIISIRFSIASILPGIIQLTFPVCYRSWLGYHIVRFSEFVFSSDAVLQLIWLFSPCFQYLSHFFLNNNIFLVQDIANYCDIFS